MVGDFEFGRIRFAMHLQVPDFLASRKFRRDDDERCLTAQYRSKKVKQSEF